MFSESSFSERPLYCI